MAKKPTIKELVATHINGLRSIAAGSCSYECVDPRTNTPVDITALVHPDCTGKVMNNVEFLDAVRASGIPADETLLSTTYRSLLQWAKAHGLDSRAGFGSFKKALLAHGIDYDALRAERREAQAAERETKATASLTLFCDAKARTDRFAICDAKGEPVWFGKFFDDDRDYDGEQSSGEMAAAKKAVWLASKVKAMIGAEAIRLILKIDAQWLCWANQVGKPDDDGKRGGKARALGELARKLGVVLTVEHIPGSENPADHYTVTTGFKKWQDNDLRSLVK